MVTKVHMEALSPTMEEGQLVRWLKAEGDSISGGDILAEIETDKATMELVARGSGVLRKILLPEGGTAPVGEVIAVIADPEEDIGDLDRAGEGTPKQGSSGQDGESREGQGLSEEEASGFSAPSGSGRTTEPDAGSAREDREDEEGGEGGRTKRIKASPLARRLAEEADLDLAALRGSGPGGRIVKRDVREAADGREEGDGAVSGPGSVRGVVSQRPSGEDFRDVPLSQMRKTIARRLVESLGPVPHFFLRVGVDMTRVLEAREEVNRILAGQRARVSINDFILKATASALALHPEVNAQWQGDSVRQHFRVHLGVAVAVEDGLITPVVRDAHLKGLARISEEVREMAARGKEKKLKPEEYTGSTFSVSNLGMFGIDEFTGVINPPEAGILAVGAVKDTPVVDGEAVVVRPIMQVTMSCDHRVVDGATGARFLQTLRGMLEEPGAMLI